MIEPEWNAENINKKQGDTTFKTCGWCEHVSCGSCRYNCYLKATCSLMGEYDEERNVTWDTPCKIMKLGQEDQKALILSKQYEITSLKKRIKQFIKQIRVLRNLNFGYKPPLPNHRNYSYKDGEVIYIMHGNKWNRGIVVPGYRSGDGCVSYVLDNYPESKTKGPWGCGVGVPGVLKEKEYKYFKKNTEAFWDWLQMCDHEYNGSKVGIKTYYEAMIGMEA